MRATELKPLEKHIAFRWVNTYSVEKLKGRKLKERNVGIKS